MAFHTEANTLHPDKFFPGPHTPAALFPS